MGKQGTQKRNSTVFQWVIPTAAFIIILFSSIVNYYSSVKKNSMDGVVASLQDQNNMLSMEYSNEMNTLLRLTQYAADVISTKPNIWSEECVQTIKFLANNKWVKRVYIQKRNGSAIDDKGKNFSYYKSNNEYTRILDGKLLISDYFEDEDGELVLLISSPINNTEEMKGAVTVVFRPTVLPDLIKKSTFLSTNEYYIISEDGEIAESYTISSDGLSIESNVLKEIKEKEFVIGSFSDIESHIKKNRPGYAAVKLNEKLTEYLFYQPIQEGQIVSIMMVNDSQVSKTLKQVMRKTNRMIILIVVYVLSFIFVVSFISVVNKSRYDKENKDLQDKAETDLLTDLYNKISTEKKIKEYMAGEGKKQKGVLFVLDVDNFKRINDTMGHAFGDEVIASLGKQLKAEFRVNDIVGRTGGDEFTIFLKNMKDDDSIQREADRLIRFFQNFKVGEYTKYFATASIGVARYPIDGGDFESLYKAADAALYVSKKRGKNQLSYYKDNENQKVSQ